MADELQHFPVYIGDALKKFIEFPSMEERGAWISIVVAMIHNDGELPNDDSLYRYALVFDETDKQCLSKALAKLKQTGCIEEVIALINKQKSLRKARQEAGKKGGKKSRKNKQSSRKSESESESESNTESESESKPSSRPSDEGTTMEADFMIPDDWIEEACKERSVSRQVVLDWFEDFRDYWHGERKKKSGRKKNWRATWRNNYRRQTVPYDMKVQEQDSESVTSIFDRLRKEGKIK